MLSKAEEQRAEDPVGMLRQYRETKDIALRNRLVMHYSYIAKAVAVQMRGISSNYAQIEDTVNQGVITLMDCVERFDPDKGIKFESYAFMRVRGAIIDFIRKQDWVPRRVRMTSKDIAAAREALCNQLMREPTDREIADYLKISLETLNKYYGEISNSVMLSFEGTVQNALQSEKFDSFYDLDAIPDKQLFKQELRDTLAKAIESLTDRERQVVTLYYFERLKLSDIAKILKVSEQRISQINSKAIVKLKQKMDQYMKG